MTVVAAVDTDGNVELILTEAIKLVIALGEELHIVHVREYSELKQGADSDAEIDQRSVQQQVQDDAARIASPIVDEFTAIGLIGKPAPEVISYAKSIDATYVVIGGKKRSPVGKAVFGSMTSRSFSTLRVRS